MPQSVRSEVASRRLSPPTSGESERLDLVVELLARVVDLLDPPAPDEGDDVLLEEPAAPAKKAPVKKAAPTR